MKSTASSSKAPYSNLTRRLHILMLILCLFASLSLYIVESRSYKVIFSLILIAYAAFLITNSHILRLVFKISGSEGKRDYFKIHEWKAHPSTSAEKDEVSHIKALEAQSKKNSTSTAKDEVSLESVERSFLKDESISSYRGMSTSYINESHLSSSKKIKPMESRGFDLLDLSFLSDNKSQIKSLGKSSASSEKTFQILDRKSIARKKINAYKSQSQKMYEEQLSEIKKSGKYIQSRYKIILNSIHSIVNPIINEHKSNTAKIQEVAADHLEIIIDTKPSKLEIFTTQQLKPSTLPVKITLQALIQKLLYVYSRAAPMQHTKLPLKKNKSWNDFEKKINELLRNRIRLAETMGVNTESLSSNVKRGSVTIIEQYNNYISMIETYIAADLQSKKSFESSLEELPDQNLLKEFKSRIYILYLYVKQLNQLLKGSIKIDLKDYLGFKQMVCGNIDFEISPKYSYDAYVPYFNLFALEKEQKKCYPCEYGTSNYLSIIYFLIYCLSKKADALKDRYQILRIINQTL